MLSPGPPANMEDAETGTPKLALSHPELRIRTHLRHVREGLVQDWARGPSSASQPVEGLIISGIRK